MNEHVCDIVIIGGGPAGLTAGLYCSRALLSTVLVERMGCGGQAATADNIENYPAYPDGIAGYELTAKMEEQAKKFGVTVTNGEVVEIADLGATKRVRTADAAYQCKSIIIATGADHRHLNVPGENEFHGKGVSYCATCDGAFYRNKAVAVVGGGDSAIQEALFLTRFASKVYVIHRRDSLRATAVLQQRARANDKIEFVLNAVVARIEGKNNVEQVVVSQLATNGERVLPVEGIFVYIGLSPNTTFARNLVNLDAAGYILTDDTMKTSIPGIYACGDSRKKLLRQVVTAAGDGATAAFAAIEYIDHLHSS